MFLVSDLDLDLFLIVLLGVEGSASISGEAIVRELVHQRVDLGVDWA